MTPSEGLDGRDVSAPRRRVHAATRAAAFVAALAIVLAACAPPAAPTAGASSPLPDGWVERVTQIRWVDYNPSEGNPDEGVAPNEESVAADLDSLRTAGFTGLITYGPPSPANLEAAEAAGFVGVIVGIWDPTRSDELRQAEADAASPIVLGYCIGNEGIMRGDYTLADLESAAPRLRTTGLPLTTTEMSFQYAAVPGLLAFGDWVFPNVHPFHNGISDPARAVTWTEDQYDGLTAGTDRFVMIKETGLPHGGADDVSEQRQLGFYSALATTDVPFAYFEAFDGEWKDGASYEPFWGVFHADRSPTLLGDYLVGEG